MKSKNGYLKAIARSLGADDDDSRNEIYWLKKILQGLVNISGGDLTEYIKKSNTVGLIKNDGSVDTTIYLTQHQSLTSKDVTVEKQSSPDSGYSATYVVKQNGVQVGDKINIPLDFLVKGASVKTCVTANSPVNGYKQGDLYIEWIINVAEGSANNQYLYLNVTDFIDIYSGDNTTIVVDSNNIISVKEGVFAFATHTHTSSDISDMETESITFTFDDDSSETLLFFKQVSNNQGGS